MRLQEFSHDEDVKRLPILVYDWDYEKVTAGYVDH